MIEFDEDRLVALEQRRIAEGLAHAPEVVLAIGLVRAHGRVRAADPAGEIARQLPIAEADLVAGPALHRELAGLEVEEQRAWRVQRPQLARLADAGDSGQHALDAPWLGQALVSGDDPQPAGGRAAHDGILMSSGARSAMRAAPSAPVTRAWS